MIEGFKPIIVIGTLLLTAVESFSQIDTSVLRARHEASPRDVEALTAYVDALEQAGDIKEAESLVRDFMSHCPVTQIEDRDTYLLISRYVFEDPYSNVFEYALFLMPRMKWDSEELTPQQKEERTKQKLTDLKWGVSHGNEVDKRYEVLSLLSRKLNKAVSELCDPQWEKSGHYIMPDYNDYRIKHLGRLLNKNNIIGKDAMRTKLKIAEAINKGDYSRALRYLCTASELDIQGINGTYLIGVMHILADMKPDAADIIDAIAVLTEQCRISEAQNTGVNYYAVLGKLYQQTGDNLTAEKYFDKSAVLEAERKILYQEMMNTSIE